jgi:hypothetical protein
VNWQTSLRTPDSVRDEWSEASGSPLFTSDRYTRALDDVMKRIDASTSESVVNRNNAAIARGCAALGYEHTSSHEIPPAAIWSSAGTVCTDAAEARNGRRPRRICATHSARRYRRSSRAAKRIASLCRGAARSASSRRRLGSTDRRVRVTVRAPRVIVAAGGIESPALLLRSGLRHPQLGRNLFLHPTTAAIGLYADLVESWRGAPQTIICEQFTALDGAFGFRLEAAPVHPGLIAYAVPWTSARQFRRLAQRFSHAAAMIALTRDADGGRVRVRRDGSAAIDYAPTTRQSAILARGMAEAARVHLAAGADEVISLHTVPLSLRRTSATRGEDIAAFCERIASAPHGTKSIRRVQRASDGNMPHGPRRQIGRV